MKKIIKFFITFSLVLSIPFAKDWVDIGSPDPSEPEWVVISDSEENIVPPGVIISTSGTVNLYAKEKYTVQFGGVVYDGMHPNEITIIRSRK